MTERLWITSHVQSLLRDIWGRDQLATDADGDFPFSCGSAQAWVRVLDAEPIMVRVFAHAVEDVRRSAKLHAELNSIQCRLLSASIWLDEDTVVVAQTISPIGLTRPVLVQALTSVCTVADDIGSLLASVFGGSTPRTPATSPTDQESR